MRMMAMAGLLGVALLTVALASANAAKETVYTLGGYTFGGFSGVNTAELAAKLKDQPAARVTQEDLSTDIAMFTAELKARRVRGRLSSSFAEKHGTIWVIFDLQPFAPGAAIYDGQPLKTQTFEGATRIPAGALATATQLKPGDALSYEKIRVAHNAILALYAKSAPGKAPTLRTRARILESGEVALTWLIGEQ